MARPPDLERRAALLDALVEAFGSGGIGDRSLRDIAEAVGTSHRMLLHHFGSRDELLLTIVDEVESRQRATLPDTATEAHGAPRVRDPADAVAAMWADVRRPELRPFERLFFECYSRGAQGEAPFARMVPGAVDSWLAAIDERTAGAADPAFARLGLAVIRGLLLDLVATDDDDGVDAAAQAFVDLLRVAQTSAASLPASRST